MEPVAKETTARRSARARAQYDRAYADLIESIKADLADGVQVKDVAEAVRWSRQYVTDVRDGKAGDAPPRMRTTDRRTSGAVKAE
jgi:hypothetical protein